MRSILNILDNSGRRFPYLVDMISDRDRLVQNNFELLSVRETSAIDGSNILIFSDTVDDSSMSEAYLSYYRTTNVWKLGSFAPEPVHHGIPDITSYSRIRLYVPDANPSVYSKKPRYAVDIDLKIGETKIVLATTVFSQMDLLSLEKPFQEAGYDYHQYIDIVTLDPWRILYDPNFREFREDMCYGNSDNDITNGCGALLDVELNVVDEDTTRTYYRGSDAETDTIVETYIDATDYIVSDDFRSARNFIQVSSSDSDYMHLSLEEMHQDCVTKFLCSLHFNEMYSGKLYDYLSETYLMDRVNSIVYELVVMDRDNIYKIVDSEKISISGNSAPEHPELYTFGTSDIRFSDWSEYHEGMYLVASARLIGLENVDGNFLDVELMALLSNSIPIDIRLFSMLVGEETVINISDLEMDILELDVVNKIEKKVVSVQRPDEYKSNIIKPVFYRAYPAEHIELHGNVSFNIGVDLDNYKSKVDNFSIQVEGNVFPETGRVPGYVIFRIDGEKLPRENETGTYYIVDGEGVLVTTGKYSYAD